MDLAKEMFRHNGLLGILGITYTFSGGIYKVPLDDDRGLGETWGWDLVVDLEGGLSYWHDQV